MLDGIILVDKPKGWTSHDAVAKVRNILKKAADKKIKVGHTGTLDPMASGLLVLVVGLYTKRAGEFSKLDKVYETTLKLGETSSTGDSEGEKTRISTKRPDEMSIKNAIVDHTGAYEQMPPAYSAIKIDGRRAYDLARRGKEVRLEPRKVKIYEITDMKYDYPLVLFTARVSSGTYVRSLAEDIGKKLGTGAYLTELRRTRVGEFSIAEASSPTEVNIDKIIKI